METLTKRAYFNREDYTLRIVARIPRTYAEELWEKNNPGYELHVARSWEDIKPGTEIFRGYAGEENSTLVSYELQEGWKEVITEEDKGRYPYPNGKRIHGTSWEINIRTQRIVVKV